MSNRGGFNLPLYPFLIEGEIMVSRLWGQEMEEIIHRGGGE
jgi:hypothetical protein